MKEQVINKINEMIENEEIETTLDAEQLYEYSFLLTQYEKYGEVGHDEIVKLIIDEYFPNSDVELWQWNEYCDANRYYDDEVFVLDEEFFNVYYYGNPYKLAEDISGNNDFHLMDDYVRFTVYGLESLDDYRDVIDSDYKEWCIDNEMYLNKESEEILENQDAIISICNYMVTLGY